MSEDHPEETDARPDLTDAAREKLTQAQELAKDALTGATDYIRAHPWLAVAGGAVLGGLIAALSRPKPDPGKLDAVREWLDEAYARLPDQGDLRSAAESTGIPCLLKKLRKSLHID